MEKIKLPNFIDYTYKNWHFWTIVILLSFALGFSGMIEFLGTLGGVTFTLSIFYFFSYLLTKSTFKKMNKI